MPLSDNSKYRILVVEDDYANIIVVTHYLEELGYPFDIARSGEEAIKIIAKKHYSLVLMDIRMTGRDGIETTRIIRSMEMSGEIQSVPIIALTADGDKERCLEGGMDDFITKPVILKTLKEKLIANIDRD